MQNLEYTTFTKDTHKYEVVFMNSDIVIIEMNDLEVIIPKEDWLPREFKVFYNYEYQIFPRGDVTFVEGDKLCKYFEEGGERPWS